MTYTMDFLKHASVTRVKALANVILGDPGAASREEGIFKVRKFKCLTFFSSCPWVSENGRMRDLALAKKTKESSGRGRGGLISRPDTICLRERPKATNTQLGFNEEMLQLLTVIICL